MKEGLVSVIIPFYNTEKYLEESINSVISQTYINWELFLVDDASTDSSITIARKYEAQDKRIKVLPLEFNKGKADAINYALDFVGGQYIAFLDGDDIWMPTKLERQIEFMKNGGYPIGSTSYTQFYDKTGNEGRLFKALEKVDYKRMLLDCPVGNSTVIYDASIIGIQKVPNIRKRSDDALWLQILRITPYIWGVNEVLMKYRIREASLSSKKMSLIKYHWKLYRSIEKMNIFSSCFHIFYWCLIKVLGIK